MAVTESKLVRDLVGAIKDGTKEKTKAYETPATVTRIEDGTAWVHVPGGVEETPVQLTINATEGDQVRVRVANGKATIVGNVTSPPTDDSTAKEALANANSAIQSARNAATAAASAEVSAETAKAAAEDAVETAESVHDIAVQAQTDANTAKANAQTAINNAAAAQTAAANAQTSADSAQTSADSASEYAARALGNLSTVQNVAETLNWIASHGTMTLTTDTALDPTHVYFVQDNNGDYTVGGTRYAVVTEPNVANISTYYELSIDESLNNYVATHLAVDSEGLWIVPDVGGNKVLIATGQGSTYTSAGTYIIGNGGDVLAKFAESEIIVGKNDNTEAYLKLDYHSLQLIDKEGDDRFVVKDLRNEQGNATITEEFFGDGTTKIFYVGATIRSFISATVDGEPVTPDYVAIYGYGISFSTAPQEGASIIITYITRNSEAWIATIGERANGTEGLSSVAIGQKVVASGARSQAFGNKTIASGKSSHAEGSYINLNGIDYFPTASGEASHCEGCGTMASGEASHCEGYISVASGNNSHAEGRKTTASGKRSHAEGYNTIASGENSHAQNSGTIAAKIHQTAIGKYNVEDTETTDSKQKAFIIGNGIDENNRSNAFTVDWNGNVDANGDVTDGSGNVLSDMVAKSMLLDFCHPVGSSYETVDASFDPNVSWGGTWELLPEGTIILAGSESGTYQVGTDTSTGSGYKEYGSNTHTLSIDEMPSHNHGSKSLTGSMYVMTWHNGWANGIVSMSNQHKDKTPGSGSSEGAATFTVNATHTHDSQGGGQAHSIMQKSIAMYIWIRTA